jgi:oxytocin receptor
VAVLATIFLLALTSNGLVLVALARQLRRKPSSRMYTLMYHLSIADMLVAMLNIFPQMVWDITFR